MRYCAEEDHEWLVDGPGVTFRQLNVYCGVCDVTAEAVIARIDYEDLDDEEEDD